MDKNQLSEFYSFLKYSGIVKSKSDFAEKMSYTRQYATEAINGSKAITDEFVSKLKAVFGEAFEKYERGEKPAKTSGGVPRYSDVKMVLMPMASDVFTNNFGNQFYPLEDGRFIMACPIVPHYVKGGPMAGFADLEYFVELPKHYVTVDKIHRGKYLAFEMLGNSMDYDGRDYIAEGARITARELKKELWVGAKLHLNQYKDFVIEHTDGLTVKRIIEHDTKRHIIVCRSLNPDKRKYPDFTLQLSEVLNLFNVIKVENPR